MATDYMTAEELEELTGTPASTFRYWALLEPPQGPRSIKLGRRRVWKRSDLMAWLDEQYNADRVGT